MTGQVDRSVVVPVRDAGMELTFGNWSDDRDGERVRSGMVVMLR